MERICDKVAGGGPTFVCRKPGGNNWGVRRTLQPRILVQGNKASKPKICGGVVVGETPSLTAEFIGETHRVLEHTQTHPSENPHQKGPI